MTDNQRDVLRALNLIAMRAEHPATGMFTEEIAKAAGRSNRSTAVVLSQMRDFGWVQSTHNRELLGWALTAKGDAALDRDAGRIPA